MTPQDEFYLTIARVLNATAWLRFCLLMPLIVGYIALMAYVFIWTIR